MASPGVKISESSNSKQVKKKQNKQTKKNTCNHMFSEVLPVPSHSFFRLGKMLLKIAMFR